MNTIAKKLIEIFIISMVLMSSTFVAAVPTSRFTSIESAVQAAADRYNPISIENDREYMGAIFEQDGLYTYSVATGEVGGDSINIRVPAKDWPSVVAFWHTHGNAAKGHQYFSQVDTATANQFNKPFYLADYTGKLKVFRPGGYTLSRRNAHKLGLRAKKGYAIGEQVTDANNIAINVNTTINLRLDEPLNLQIAER